MASDNNYAIYQNHPLDSRINVSVHYVTLAKDGSSFEVSDEDQCNATLYSVRDITNNKRWFVCEIHMDDQKIHGTMTVYDRQVAQRSVTKQKLLEEISNFIQETKNDQIFLKS